MPERQLSLEQQLSICRQVARLVRAKLPIAGHLGRAPAGDNSSDSAAQMVDEQVAQGQSLATALAADDSRDSRILAACIAAGEASDALDSSLERWAGMHLANHRMRSAMRSAIFYPCLLIAATITSLSFLTWSLIPEYVATYTMFGRPIPFWLEAAVWVREHLALFVVASVLLSFLPLAYFFWRRRQHDAQGLPIDASRRMRLHALASEGAADMLSAKVPLKQVVGITVRTYGASQSQVDQAFASLQKQQHVVPIANETSLLLCSLHAGLMASDEVVENLHAVAKHFQQGADLAASRNARWIPAIVALSVGCIAVLTYSCLLYWPWIYLLQTIVRPVAE